MNNINVVRPMSGEMEVLGGVPDVKKLIKDGRLKLVKSAKKARRKLKQWRRPIWLSFMPGSDFYLRLTKSEADLCMSDPPLPMSVSYNDDIFIIILHCDNTTPYRLFEKHGWLSP